MSDRRLCGCPVNAMCMHTDKEILKLSRAHFGKELQATQNQLSFRDFLIGLNVPSEVIEEMENS